MKSSKPIERLFQEGLNDLQTSPSPKVWKGIEEKLSGRKKKKRFAAFWWQVVSVAAILLIFSSIGAFYFQNAETKSSVSSKENSEIKRNLNSIVVTPAQYRFTSVSTALSSFENDIENSLAFQLEVPKSVIESPKLADAEGDDAINPQVTGISSSYVNQLVKAELKYLQNLRIASNLLSNELKEDLTLGDNVEKKSLFDAIEEEPFLVVEDDKQIYKPWELTPNVAPVFMNSFSGGNPIEASLQGKTTSNPNVSYGINVAYAINKKIKIRTGVNQVAMGYNTQDVILSTTSSSFSSDNSNNPNIKNDILTEVTLVSATNRRVGGRNATMSDPGNSSFLSSTSEYNSIGSLNHELGFVEVPVEIEYAIIDKKIGLHVLGGASTYLLNNNEIFFEEGGRSSSIGEAENLNSFSFSANLGLGLDYNFSETLSLNLEPKFLYQINTFQDTDSSFQPYFFGIYSGIRFKF
jgi:hypothetical protein